MLTGSIFVPTGFLAINFKRKIIENKDESSMNALPEDNWRVIYLGNCTKADINKVDTLLVTGVIRQTLFTEWFYPDRYFYLNTSFLGAIYDSSK